MLPDDTFSVPFDHMSCPNLNKNKALDRRDCTLSCQTKFLHQYIQHVIQSKVNIGTYQFL